MVEKRYQIYMASSYNDVVNERLKVEYALLNSSCFPWQFSEKRSSLNTARARQQIDDADYVVFLLSSCYGDLSASGISYLHLDFLYALNKNKIIISLVDAYPEKKFCIEQKQAEESLKKLSSFRAILKRDSTYYQQYSNLLDLERSTKNLLATAIKERPAKGWIRPQPQDHLAEDPELMRLRSKIADLQKQLEASTLVAVKTTESSREQRSPNSDQDETIKLAYRAHAYQDGNLQDIHPQREMTWAQILKVLAPHFKKPALESTFIRAMNDYLETTALEDARAIFPRAHAVARTQVDSRSLQQIKLQMKWNNWIVPQQQNLAGSRIYWALTQEGQKHLL